jgi:hypothetical protein
LMLDGMRAERRAPTDEPKPKKKRR